MGLNVHGFQPVERYSFLGFWSLHLYRYSAELIVNEESFLIEPGCVSLVPPDARLEYRFRGRSPHLCAHFRFEADDTGAAPAGMPVSIAIMQKLGPDLELFSELFEQAVGCFATNRLRAEVRIWDLLWQLASRDPAQGHDLPATDPIVKQAVRLIELRLAQPISIPDLAGELGISHNHLLRLFHNTLQMTVSAFIRARRMEKAKQFLMHSTLPIKAIAVQVGVPDLHLFNKTVRRSFGASPRAIRTRSGRQRLMHRPERGAAW